jgi:hypothetical protein
MHEPTGLNEKQEDFENIFTRQCNIPTLDRNDQKLTIVSLTNLHVVTNVVMRLLILLNRQLAK